MVKFGTINMEILCKLIGRTNTYRLKRHRSIAAVLSLLCIVVLLTGCGNKEDSNLKVVLTTGFAPEEVFQIEKEVCTKAELMVYLTNMQNQYEAVYGDAIWETNVEDKSLEESVKDNALAKLAQVKTMNLMAKQHAAALSQKEQQAVDKAVETYYDSLNAKEIELMGITKDTIRQLYTEYALAQKIYRYIIKDINPEVSDDEARNITVKYILVKTYAMDGTGKKISYTENARRKALEKAQEAWKEAKAGEDFDELIRKYSEDENGTYSFGKGEADPAFEETAFNLGNGEISDIVETEDGFEIILCINTFDRNETDANKIKIVEEKREQVFGEQYDAFLETLTTRLNEKLWNEISFIRDENVTTSDFFDVFRTYCDEIGDTER